MNACDRLCARAFHWPASLFVGLAFAAALLVTCLTGAFAFADDANEVNEGQLPDSSFIYETQLYDLMTSDAYYENQTVQVTGEIVGDRINNESDSSKCWVTLSSLPDTNAASVQVLVSNDQADQIDTYGRYNAMGTTVTVMGVYHLVCPEHEGLSDLHAQTLTVTEAGKQHAAPFNFTLFVPGILLLCLGIGLLLFYQREKERLR